MSNKKHNIPRLQDFLDYIHQRMNPGQRHALEKQMQKDAFAEEAMEGLAGIDEARARNDIKALNQRFRHKGSSVRRLWIAGIAASIALLIITGVTFMAIERTRTLVDSTMLSREELPVPIISETIEDPIAEETEPMDDTMLSTQKVQNAKKEEVQMPVPEQEELTILDFDIAYDMESQLITVELEEVILPQVTGAVVEMRKETPQPEIQKTESTSPIRIRGIAAAREPGQRILRGKVVDAWDGNPLPGVTIAIAGTTTGAMTNTDGQFEIRVPAGENVKLVASFIGMETQEFYADNFSEHEVLAMEANLASLSEVVVVTHGTTARISEQELKSQSYRTHSTYRDPQPAEGWMAYRRYIRANAILLDTATVNRVVLVINFDVDINGKPYNYEVSDSPGSFYTSKAIELINNGPAWQPASAKGVLLEENIRMRIVFRKKE